MEAHVPILMAVYQSHCRVARLPDAELSTAWRTMLAYQESDGETLFRWATGPLPEMERFMGMEGQLADVSSMDVGHSRRIELDVIESHLEAQLGAH